MIKSIQIPLARPRLSEDDIQAAVDILRSGILVNGPVVEKFEQCLADYLGVRHVVCASSGTAALQLGLVALGLGRGDDVIVPAFSYPATANVIELVGAKPIFIESEPDGFNLDVSKIENSITPKTRAIMVVHNFGWPAEMESVNALADKYGFPVFEDAACALGSAIGGARCGSLGKLAAFSFHPRKALTTGEGGALATNDATIAEKVRLLRNHGQIVGKTIEFVLPGFNYRLSEFQGALGLSQLSRFDDIVAFRQKAADYYDKELSCLPYINIIKSRSDHFVNYQTYAAYVHESNRDRLIEHLRNLGIGAGIGTYSIPHLKFYSQKYSFRDLDFPNSYSAYRNLISLPLYEGITKADQKNVIEAIKSFRPSDKDEKKINFNQVKGLANNVRT
jgi:dTDP-4-amino-4,6-dideoxygalactose transaminase